MIEQWNNGLYRKPTEICHHYSEFESIESLQEAQPFIDSKKKEFEDFLAEKGLIVRKATYNDLDAFFAYAKARFAKLLGSTPMYSPYWLDHLISAGHPMLLFDSNNNIKGYQLEASYLDQERTSNGGGIAVDDDLKGMKMAMRLFDYVALLAMEKGAKVKRGIIAAYNFPSVNNVLNRSGAIFTDVIPNLTGHGQRFIYKFGLTPAGIENNRIDKLKLASFLDSNLSGTDYELVLAEDAQGILKMYQETEFRIVAMLRGGTEAEKQTYVALPKDQLGFPDLS